MRVALISLGDEPGAVAGAATMMIAGRSLTLRQVDFALACGCERIIAVGQPGGDAALSVRAAAHIAGTRLDVARDAHALLGTVSAADELLVLAPRLVAGSEQAQAAIAAGSGVLTLPAEEAVAAGFERIDRERAWAGAALLPGRLVEHLAELPGDSAPASALLRIALQDRLPERQLPLEIVRDGSWAIVGGDARVEEIEGRWRRRFRDAVPGHAVSAWIASRAMERWGQRLLADRRVFPGLLAGAAVLLLAAVALAAGGHAAAGLTLAALAMPCGALAAELSRVERGPYAARSRRLPLDSTLAWGVDATLLLCGALAIGGTWFERLFPPLVLFGALHLRPLGQLPAALAVLGDRLVLGLAMALGAALGYAQPAIMLLALAYLGAELARRRRKQKNLTKPPGA